jgi:hypothetical protein
MPDFHVIATSDSSRRATLMDRHGVLHVVQGARDLPPQGVDIAGVYPVA